MGDAEHGGQDRPGSVRGVPAVVDAHLRLPVGHVGPGDLLQLVVVEPNEVLVELALVILPGPFPLLGVGQPVGEQGLEGGGTPEGHANSLGVAPIGDGTRQLLRFGSGLMDRYLAEPTDPNANRPATDPAIEIEGLDARRRHTEGEGRGLGVVETYTLPVAGGCRPSSRVLENGIRS